MMPEQRNRFVRLLRRLGDDDPVVRASTAEAVVNTMRTRGWSWDALIVQTPANMPAPEVLDDWRVTVARLLVRADLLPAEDAAWLRKVSAWRSPGADGLIRLRRIAEVVARRDRAA